MEVVIAICNANKVFRYLWGHGSSTVIHPIDQMVQKVPTWAILSLQLRALKKKKEEKRRTMIQ